jgi:hypothetical protein|tara:strand:+ start:79 stop:258 length:180 start_codon:yes stop_codon:yes gene_type:complete
MSNKIKGILLLASLGLAVSCLSKRPHAQELYHDLQYGDEESDFFEDEFEDLPEEEDTGL